MSTITDMLSEPASLRPRHTTTINGTSRQSRTPPTVQIRFTSMAERRVDSGELPAGIQLRLFLFCWHVLYVPCRRWQLELALPEWNNRRSHSFRHSVVRRLDSDRVQQSVIACNLLSIHHSQYRTDSASIHRPVRQPSSAICGPGRVHRLGRLVNLRRSARFALGNRPLYRAERRQLAAGGDDHRDQPGYWHGHRQRVGHLLAPPRPLRLQPTASSRTRQVPRRHSPRPFSISKAILRSESPWASSSRVPTAHSATGQRTATGLLHIPTRALTAAATLSLLRRASRANHSRPTP